MAETPDADLEARSAAIEESARAELGGDRITGHTEENKAPSKILSASARSAA